jgi:S-adenosylmethionine hydrolase
MNRERPIIALLTDFGLRDPYVAAMKGVIAARSEARIIDLTHDIAPFDRFEAAMFLDAVVGSLPSGGRTVVVIVVDPGVGSERRIIAAADGGRTFLAPDNGVLPLVLTADATVRIVENRDLFLADVSRTFHGRDIFAPVAAALAEGLELSAVGPETELSSLVRLNYERPRREGDHTVGTVIAVDRFGNLVTDLVASSDGYALDIRGVEVTLSVWSYAAAPAEIPFVIRGSRGTLEISVRNGSAAALLQAARGDRVTLKPVGRGMESSQS